MELRENYKIENDGIWISKEELREWREHHKNKMIELKETDHSLAMYYAGKCDVFTDILRTFETLSP